MGIIHLLHHSNGITRPTLLKLLSLCVSHKWWLRERIFNPYNAKSTSRLVTVRVTEEGMS